jgi:hypothetical protein
MIGSATNLPFLNGAKTNVSFLGVSTPAKFLLENL